MNDNININPDASIDARQGTFILDLPFILTTGKTLITGMPYMLMEGNRTNAVRLLKVWTEDNIIYLEVLELKSPKTFCLSWNLEYSGSYYLWTIADYETLTDLPK